MVPCSMEVGVAPGGDKGCPADKMGDGAVFWKGAFSECMLNEPQVTLHFVADEIEACALVQRPDIDVLAEGTFLVPVVCWCSKFSGLQCSVESLVCVLEVGSGCAVCMCEGRVDVP